MLRAGLITGSVVPRVALTPRSNLVPRAGIEPAAAGLGFRCSSI